MTSTPQTMHLQQQAAARVREMEERSRRLVQEHPVNIYRGIALTPPVEQTAPPCPPLPCTGGGLSALFGGDNERLLVLLLAAVLAKNGAPLELLLALLYVAL